MVDIDSRKVRWRPMPARHSATRVAVFCLLAMIGAACGETQPSHFYSLSPASQPETGVVSQDAASQISIGVGPVDLPKYLDRLPLVRFTTANKVDISEYDRWAEPLADNFARTVGENLSIMLPTRLVDVYPFMANSSNSFSRQIVIDVSQFRANPNNTVELRAFWRVIEPDRRRSIGSGTFAFSEPITGDGYEAIVSAMSRAVAALSRDIAAGLRDLPRVAETAR
jgi:uncharacterized lipoprotein YmbA